VRFFILQQQERLHALDAVRAFALLLGIFFHAAMSFIDVEVESLHWAIADDSQSSMLLLFVGVSHMFRMALFFFIAGYFARLVYHRKGAAEFARNRAMRIALPFVVGWCVIAPSLRAIWHWGRTKTGITSELALWPGANEWASGQINLTHLWFLYYLALLYILIVGLRHVLIERLDRSGDTRRKIDAALRVVLDRYVAPLVLSIPIAIVAIFATEWNPGSGMPTPDQSLAPNIIALVGYGTVFLTGWLFHRTPDSLQVLAQRVRSSLWLALLALILTAVFGSVHGMQPKFFPEVLRFLGAIAATSLMWYFNFALIGFALNRFANPSRVTRYVADASYWVYIAHLPVVCVLQVWVARWPLHWTVKYLFIVGVAFAVLFASYHYIVRFTFIGAVLNGRKYRHNDPTTLRSEAGA
jgi:peptidoglycan/LPS O-acetylase OafA/YrhL